MCKKKLCHLYNCIQKKNQSENPCENNKKIEPFVHFYNKAPTPTKLQKQNLDNLQENDVLESS